VTGRISPQPGARSQNACAPPAGRTESIERTYAK
jgi:hypothetical protein